MNLIPKIHRQRLLFDGQDLSKGDDQVERFICKIATVEEMIVKWDSEIERNVQNRSNWMIWKQKNIENRKQGNIIPYYGILDGTIICEATAMLRPDTVQNSAGLVDDHTAYLSAFRTVNEYQGRGYFSKLFQFMIHDLRQKGYTKVTLGVEPTDEKNKKIYAHYGFTEYIKSGRESYPDGTEIDVEYYRKTIE